MKSKEEKTLSDEIEYENGRGVIDIIDVKEFVKKLKKFIDELVGEKLKR